MPKPLFALAPMADVTDAAFRRVIAKYGKPDVMWTEFVSADGLFLGGYDKLIKDLEYSEAERPIVAQFFSADVGRMKKAAELAQDLGFDGVDINMGCPDKNVEKQMAGSAMIKNPQLAKEIIKAAKEGAGPLPVSVKTRIGYNKVEEIEEWLPALLSENPAAVTLHARTKSEMSKVPAHWETIKRAVEIRNTLGSKTLIVGNGDVVDLSDAKAKAEETGCDGVMVGRAIFGNPWFFAENPRIPSSREKLKVLAEHIKLFDEFLGDVKNFAVMKKHFKAYVSGWSASPAGGDGARDLRQKLMETRNAKEAILILKNTGFLFPAHLTENL